MASPFLLGLRALWRAWTEPDFARRIDPLLGGRPAPEPVVEPAVTSPPPTPVPTRSDALALLAVLQREGRFLDFLEEPVDGYSDAEVGLAVRALHKECGAAVRRMFGLQPLLPQAEGSSVEVPAGHDPARYRFVGARVGGVSGTVRGTLVHPGWRATRAELPAWTGREESAQVLAPAEVEATLQAE